ncbi:hypothetical protein SAMN05660659_02009 [Pseudomonas sp. LAMO17WK12:I6]|uniref:hypothetical protein n=1 Tax=unclassified Pseudomonas TaxID=196821 RepID=UPI000BDDB8F4|nr:MULTISPECIES: hypothetical protein [unclassified Pseudomonas]SNY21278.1 hypothetical protein SAMN05660659_02009 [Pseudomonas sp. LAMO17WK12:I6]SNY24222.1 hypothetical protein SAMN05660455_02502 [Pseudomonas sp. LAMO17WK12:I5]
MHPEHHDLSTAVYLPVTDETCASLLQPDGAKTLGELTDAQLAAVLVIQNLAQATEKDLTAAAAEKVLARLIAWAVDGGAGLLSEAQRLFDPRQLYFGLNAIRGLNLRLLLAEEVSAQDYLLPDGKWDDEFKTRHHAINNPFSQQMISPAHRERWLSAAQDKLVRTFRANLDEDLHVQGYAGIGKSHLVGALTECLDPGKTLLLARTPEKLATLCQRMGVASERKPGITFEAFARGLIYGRKPQPASAAGRVASKQSLAQELNILGFREHDAQRTLNVCLETLERYCHSRDYSLSAHHLPYFKLSLSGLESKVLLEYSSRVWTYLEANPAWGRQSGFEALLLIKRASLAGCVVPPRYTHVLIDESQDIPASLLQIIERGRQVLITLGDEYQHAERDLVKRKREVRQSDITYSVRSGRNVERLVNPLISRHSEKSKVPFEGAREADVGIEFYPQGFVPPEGCVVLTASPWDTMKWAMQLHDANCLFSFADMKAQRDLEHFMTSAIELFKVDYYSSAHSEKGPHRYFSDLPKWQQVRDANQFDEAFLWVEAELEKGFKVADLTRLNRMIGGPGKSCLLMQAHEAGGMEFDRVLLTPELLTNVQFKDAYAFDQRICAVYIAISRARQQLYLPYDVVEWIEFHDYQKFRESHGY